MYLRFQEMQKMFQNGWFLYINPEFFKSFLTETISYSMKNIEKYKRFKKTKKGKSDNI